MKLAIHGTPDCVSKAKTMIDEIVQGLEEEEEMKIFFYKKFYHHYYDYLS
jgi:hypothetical protein